MANKTKAELEAEIKGLREQIASVNKQEQNDKAAAEMYGLYQSFIKTGFTEEQAWSLVYTLVNNGTTKKSLF